MNVNTYIKTATQSILRKLLSIITQTQPKSNRDNTVKELGTHTIQIISKYY